MILDHSDVDALRTPRFHLHDRDEFVFVPDNQIEANLSDAFPIVALGSDLAAHGGEGLFFQVAYDIKRKGKPTEFEIQAEAYHRLKLEGLCSPRREYARHEKGEVKFWHRD